MATARRVTISLPEDVLRAADEVALTQERARSALVEDALRWYLRVQELPCEEATPEEIVVGSIEHSTSSRSNRTRGDLRPLERAASRVRRRLLTEQGGAFGRRRLLPPVEPLNLGDRHRL